LASDPFSGDLSLVSRLSDTGLLAFSSGRPIALSFLRSRAQLELVDSLHQQWSERSRFSFNLPRSYGPVSWDGSYVVSTDFVLGDRLGFHAPRALYNSCLSAAVYLQSLRLTSDISCVTTFDYLVQLFRASEPFRPFLVRFESCLCRPPDTSLVPCHGDFGPHNIIYNSSISSLTLIDWEYASVCYPYFDFSWFVALLSYSGVIDPSAYFSLHPNVKHLILFSYLRMLLRIVESSSVSQQTVSRLLMLITSLLS